MPISTRLLRKILTVSIVLTHSTHSRAENSTFSNFLSVAEFLSFRYPFIILVFPFGASVFPSSSQVSFSSPCLSLSLSRCHSCRSSVRSLLGCAPRARSVPLCGLLSPALCSCDYACTTFWGKNPLSFSAQSTVFPLQFPRAACLRPFFRRLYCCCNPLLTKVLPFFPK